MFLLFYPNQVFHLLIYLKEFHLLIYLKEFHLLLSDPNRVFHLIFMYLKEFHLLIVG